MTSQSKSEIEIVYNNRPLCSFPYTEKSSIKDLKDFLSKKYSVSVERVSISQPEGSKLVDNAIISSLVKKSKKVFLDNIVSDFAFYQLENEENKFDFQFDLVATSIDDFENQINKFFNEKMKEMNCQIDGINFLGSTSEAKPFFDKTKSFSSHFLSNPEKFYFLILGSSINCYNQIVYKENEEEQDDKKELVLRPHAQSGEKFRVYIETYNNERKEVEVFPEMTVGELKEVIEYQFAVRKEYQELIYLVYKLNNEEKTLKDYYIRPNGFIFLRGFYFPLIFVDFYEKKNKNVFSINIAQQVHAIKQELIQRLQLDPNLNYKLLLGGKELDERNYLIDYNVQKMQSIYFM